MTKPEEQIEILIEAIGREETEQEVDRTAQMIENRWKHAFDVISRASPDTSSLSDTLENLQRSIAKGFDIPGIDWDSLFSGWKRPFLTNTPSSTGGMESLM